MFKLFFISWVFFFFHVFSVSAVEIPPSWQLKSKAHSLAISPDGKFLAVGLSQSLYREDGSYQPSLPGSVQLFELKSGKPVATLTIERMGGELHHNSIAPFALAFNSKGDQLAVSQIFFERLSGPLGRVSLWDVNSLQELPFDSPCQAPAVNVAFIDQDQTLLTGISLKDPVYNYNHLLVCDRATGQEIRRFEHTGTALFTRDQKYLISSGFKTHHADTLWRTTIFDGQSYQKRFELPGLSPPLRLSPDHSLLLAEMAYKNVGYSMHHADKLQLSLVDIRTGKQLKVLRLKNADRLLVWPSQQQFITLGHHPYPNYKQFLQVWDLSSGKLKRVLNLPDQLSVIRMSADNKVLVTLSQSPSGQTHGSRNTIRVWNAETLQKLQEWQL